MFPSADSARPFSSFVGSRYWTPHCPLPTLLACKGLQPVLAQAHSAAHLLSRTTDLGPPHPDMASSSVKKEVKAAAAQFREETASTLATHDQRLDRLEYRAARTEARVDALLQFSSLVAENSEKLNALWVENVEGGQGLRAGEGRRRRGGGPGGG